MGKVKSIVFVLFMGVTINFIIGACSSPRVSHTLISPESKSIEQWYIRVINQNPHQDSLPSFAILREEFGINERIKKYVWAIKVHLADEGIAIGEDSTEAGIIALMINGPGMTGEIRDIHQNRRSGYTKWSPAERDSMNSYVVLKEVDRISEVNFELKSPDGRFLGKADIGGYKIKPAFTAEVIKKLIKKGEY